MTNLPPGFSRLAIEPGAAADLEKLRILRRRCLAADQLGENAAPCPVPPVALVKLRHLLVDDTLHQRKTHWRLSVKVTAGVTNTIGTIGQAGLRCSGLVSSHTQAVFIT